MSEQWLDDVPIDGANAQTLPHLEGPRRVAVVREHVGIPHVRVTKNADGTLNVVQRMRKDRRCVGGEDNTLVVELVGDEFSENSDDTLREFGHLLRHITEEDQFGEASIESDAIAVDRAMQLSADTDEGVNSPVVVEISDSDSAIVSDDSVR